MMYEEATIEDLIQMFNNTLVMHNKWPVIIEGFISKEIAIIRSLSTGAQKQVGFDDKFDFSPVELGMVNGKDSVFYLSRRPIRRYRQGLHREHMSFMYPIKSAKAENTANRVARFENKFLVATIKNNYPTLQEALEIIDKDETEAIAFHRKFAIDKDLRLFYKDKMVGMINWENGSPIFTRGQAYLKTLLD